jgi:hypothetical protein
VTDRRLSVHNSLLATPLQQTSHATSPLTHKANSRLDFSHHTNSIATHNKTTDSPAEMSIQRLPTELIEQIIDDIAPDTHLSFALACRLLRDCSHSVLAHHRACSIELKEITDALEDFSRPKDPVAMWHNRACVVYRASSITKALQILTLRSLEI